MLLPRSQEGKREETQRLQGRTEQRRGELAALKKQMKDLAAGVLNGEVETGRAAVANQIFNTLIRAMEQERENLETGELAERLEAMEEVLKGRRTG